jgi:hypothetical protein
MTPSPDRKSRFPTAQRNSGRPRAGNGSALWGELAALKLLTNFDRAALAAYCGAYALWAQAKEVIQKYR